MNVYIELETLKRELSGKLLISLELVKKNHNVFLGDRETITYLAKNNKIPPGVIFLKDMNSQKYRVNDYKKFIKNGFKIVSQDEEIGCFTNKTYEKFFYGRFQNETTFKLVDKYFCWGDFDYKFLKKFKKKTKFIKTGSPRIDIAANEKLINKDNIKKKYKLKKNIILISLNHNLFWKRDFFERLLISTHEINEKNFIKTIDESYHIESKVLIKFFYLFELIYELNKLNDYSIVIRPHPGMETEKVKKFFDNYKILKNVKVIADGDLVDQISTSDFIIHTGCTSGVEGTLNKKNVITYLPKDNLIRDYKEVKFLTEIGKIFYKKDAIIKYIKRNAQRKFIQKNILNKNLNKIKKRVLIDKQSYKRISEEIENLSFKKTNKSYMNIGNNKLNFFKKNLKLIIKKKIKKNS